MPRRKRITLGGYVYHTLNRANGRLRIFRKDDDFLAFEQILSERKTKKMYRGHLIHMSARQSQPGTYLLKSRGLRLSILLWDTALPVNISFEMSLSVLTLLTCNSRRSSLCRTRRSGAGVQLVDFAPASNCRAAQTSYIFQLFHALCWARSNSISGRANHSISALPPRTG